VNQSSVIIGALFLAFVVFITARGKLQKYLNLLVGSGESTSKKMDKTQADLEKKSDSESTGSVPPPEVGKGPSPFGGGGSGEGGPPVPFNVPGMFGQGGIGGMLQGIPGVPKLPNFLSPGTLGPMLFGGS
jgi:hypothetical protein